MAITLSLLNMKGGVGKTTLAVNLAWHTYGRSRKRVLLIDLDPQFNASQYMMDFGAWERHVKKNGTIADLLIDSPTLHLRKPPAQRPTKERIARLKESRGGAYLDFLPSELSLAHVVKNPHQMEYKLERRLQPLRSEYDFIFIDCAPTDSVLTTMALTASNYILIPVRPDRFSILGYANLLAAIEHFKQNSNNPNNVRELGVIFTQLRYKSDIEKICMEDIREFAINNGSYVFSRELPFSETFIRAVQNQTPAFETKYARDDLKQSIADIARELRERIADVEGIRS